MRYEISPAEIQKAMHPHELFLINLIFNHVLLFIGSLGLARSHPILMGIIPAISLTILTYTLWRANRSLKVDPWFTQCHWQLAARRSIIFISLLGILAVLSLFGWLGYTNLHMPKIAVYALVGGFGFLPTMLTVLALIILESDALNQARHGKVPKWLVERFPNHEHQVIDD